MGFFKDVTDKNKALGALLRNLSKEFDCLCHDLLMVKVHDYGFVMSFLNLLQDYLSNRKQRTKPDSLFSSWEDILSGVPLGSVLDSRLFNIFMCGMFLIWKTIYFTSYADDNTPLAATDHIEIVIRFLEEVGENLITCFSDNQMKLNSASKW